MHRSSKQRQKSARGLSKAKGWKRALFAAAFAASFATGPFLMAEENGPAKRRLPTKAVAPASSEPEGLLTPVLLPPVLRPEEVNAPSAVQETSSRKTTPASPSTKLLGGKVSPIRPVAIEVIAKDGESAPLRSIPIKLVPSKSAAPSETKNEGDEKPAPIVSASSMVRPAQRKSAQEPSADSAAPLSPWMQDIRGPQAEANTKVNEEAPAAETSVTEGPEDSAPAARLPMGLSAPAKLTVFERAGSPAQTDAEVVAASNPEQMEKEPAEFTPEQVAPIVSAPKSEPKRLALSAKSLRGTPLSKPQARIEQSAEPLVLAVQNAQPGPAALPAPDRDADLKKHFEVIQQTGEFSVQVHRSKLLRTVKDIYRTAVVDDAVLEIVQFTPREISLIGRSQGSTHVTFWFDDPATQPVTYLVTVEPDAGQVIIDEKKYQLLEDMINEMFPDSKIHLQLIANKLVVRGQARDSEEAFQIMTLIRAQGGFGGGGAGGGIGGAGFAGINEGQAADPLQDNATGAARRSNYQLINMLRVPGVQQVALRVKIAELNRTAARNFGMNLTGHIDVGDSSKILLNSVLGTGGQTQPSVLFNIDGDDISLSLNTLTQAGVIKLLSEPTLVTLSGNPATFIAGGEFAVPTIVGSAGLNAVTTDFRAFGAIISFLPTVVDKDRIRLQVAPEFSQINSGLTVNGTPGLKVRAATTTVEMREGQTLAIAGLLEDSINANTAGDIPFLSRIIGKRGVTRAETELIILVTPELVHPMEPEEVPPLPGFDVTEPTNTQFYFHGDIEGNPTMDYRSTVWPRLKKRYKAGGPAMTSGPFGHGQ